MNLDCTNCYAEFEGSHHDVDFQSGQTTCPDCVKEGKDSKAAEARRDKNRKGAFNRVISKSRGLIWKGPGK